MRYAVILAGGSGTRLWPLSRQGRPKQLIPLLGQKCLLELAVDRLNGLFDPQAIFVVTNTHYADQIAQALPQLPPGNIIGEPEGRDTASAIALAAEVLARKDPEATMAVFTADHIIRPVECFAQAVRDACQAAEERPQALVTFGIRPTWPHTGLGYIHCAADADAGVHKVTAFKEKPDHRTARQYVDSGRYFWNSGMFVWKLAAIRGALDRFLPETLARIAQAVDGKAGKDLTAALVGVYPQLTRISIDFAVMEKAPEVYMVELRCEWLDVGSWPSLEAVAELDEDGNAVVAKNHILVDSTRNIVVCEDGHLLAVVGVDDCIIVHSDDATLVCNKSDAQGLKEVVGLIRGRFGQTYV